MSLENISSPITENWDQIEKELDQIEKEENLGADEDWRNPQFIPKGSNYYDHDDRKVILVLPEGKKPVKWDKDTWSHDLFNKNEQGPKSKEELENQTQELEIHDEHERNKNGKRNFSWQNRNRLYDEQGASVDKGARPSREQNDRRDPFDFRTSRSASYEPRYQPKSQYASIQENSSSRLQFNDRRYSEFGSVRKENTRSIDYRSIPPSSMNIGQGRKDPKEDAPILPSFKNNAANQKNENVAPPLVKASINNAYLLKGQNVKEGGSVNVQVIQRSEINLETRGAKADKFEKINPRTFGDHTPISFTRVGPRKPFSWNPKKAI